MWYLFLTVLVWLYLWGAFPMVVYAKAQKFFFWCERKFQKYVILKSRETGNFYCIKKGHYKNFSTWLWLGGLYIPLNKREREELVNMYKVQDFKKTTDRTKTENKYISGETSFVSYELAKECYEIDYKDF